MIGDCYILLQVIEYEDDIWLYDVILGYGCQSLAASEAQKIAGINGWPEILQLLIQKAIWDVWFKKKKTFQKTICCSSGMQVIHGHLTCTTSLWRFSLAIEWEYHGHEPAFLMGI